MATNEEMISSALERQKLTAEAVEEAKQKTEFVRYKQDCRKRALDLAHSEAMRDTMTNPLSQQRTAFPSSVTTTRRADEYYNWLISIPS